MPVTKLKKEPDRGHVYGILRKVDKSELFSVLRDEDVSNGTRNEYSLNLHCIVGCVNIRLAFLKWILEETKLPEYI